MNESVAHNTSSADADALALAATSADIDPSDPAYNGNPFSCNICKRSYKRVDHLARHYRSHTREKPFTCEICSKSFARVDLLKRHTANHDEEPAHKRQKSAQKNARARVSQACIACAEAKLRCEGSTPCDRCQQKNVRCEYAQPRSKKLMNSLPTRSEVDGSVFRDPQVGPVFPPRGSVYSVSQGTPHDMDSQLHPDNMLNMHPTHAGMEASGGGTGHEDQSLLGAHQLPTPTTFDQASAMNHEGQHYEKGDAIMTFDDLPLLDFLRDVMTPTPMHDSMRQYGSSGVNPFARDVLDFSIDTSFEFANTYNMPFLFANEQSLLPNVPLRSEGEEQSGSRSGLATPGVQRSINLATQAFKDSIWLWTPAQEDYGNSEQLNLSVPDEGIMSEAEGISTPHAREKMSQATRDRVLAMVFSTCDRAILPRVVASFPSAELLTHLLHNFLSFHSSQEVSYVHPATLRINEESPEFLAAIICSGAALSRVPALRKLGFAMQEAVRLYLPSVFENDNRSTRRLRSVQSYALHLDVALWSGDRRKMEIAESFAMPLVTMVRRAGHFRKPRHPSAAPQHSDDVKTIEAKWHSWVEAESFKRLALYLFYRDTRTSMSLLVKPLISYAELSADLPLSKDLWLAKSATEWRNIYLEKSADIEDGLPSVRACIDDTSPIFKFRHLVDVQMALAVIISTIWSLIWQYREIKTTVRYHLKDGSRNSASTATPLHQEISQLMQHLRLNATEWDGGMLPPARLLHELCLMHLHVSLEDLQLLAGKEGEDEARKSFPVLSAWAELPESRQAIFHAGQVLHAASQHARYTLRDASAVAVYHASLVLWAYSVLAKSMSTPDDGLLLTRTGSDTAGSIHQQPRHLVRLDGSDSPELQRFLVLGKGIPAIRRWTDDHDDIHDADDGDDVPLSDPLSVMTAITTILYRNNSNGTGHGEDEKSRPPLVVNLAKLMGSLGSAAAGMRRK